MRVRCVCRGRGRIQPLCFSSSFSQLQTNTCCAQFWRRAWMFSRTHEAQFYPPLPHARIFLPSAQCSIPLTVVSPTTSAHCALLSAHLGNERRGENRILNMCSNICSCCTTQPTNTTRLLPLHVKFSSYEWSEVIRARHDKLCVMSCLLCQGSVLGRGCRP